MPPEILERYSGAGADLSCVSVVSWALPFSQDVRQSNRGRDWPSPLYSVARNNGGAIIFGMSRRLTETAAWFGFVAVSPILTEEYRRVPKCGTRPQLHVV